MKVWEGGADFRETLLSDPEVATHLSEEELDACFDLKHHLRFVDEIFQRVEISDA
jgi:adenylosuccinate lyase